MEQKLKVLRTLTWLAPGGGPDEALKATLDGLNEFSEIHLLTGSVIESDDFLKDSRIKVHICPYLIPNMNPIMDLVSFFWIRRFLITESFDLIHTHETKSSFLVRIANRFAKRVPLIYGIHGVVFNDPRSRLLNDIYKILERFTLGLADAYIAVSQEILDIYLANGFKFSGPKKVIRSAIDTTKFQSEKKLRVRDIVREELDIPSDSLVFLNVGRFSKSKNQRDSILAFAELRVMNPQKDLWLLCVGYGEELSECKQLVNSLKIQESVKFLGFSRETQKYFWASDIHILSSKREGLARVLVEASLSGLPSISYPVEGAREVFPEDCTELITKSFSSSELASRMQTFVKDPQRAKTLSKSFLRNVGLEWDVDKILRETRDFYNYVLKLE